MKKMDLNGIKHTEIVRNAQKQREMDRNGQKRREMNTWEGH